VLDHSKAFLGLLELIKVSSLNEKTFNVRLQQLADFDQTLSEVRCFVNFFCNCGVRIDAHELKAKIEDLTSRYDNLPVRELQDGFGKLLQPHGSSISWLFMLRNSQLFLSLWRESGNSLLHADKADKNGLFDLLRGKFHHDEKEDIDEKGLAPMFDDEAFLNASSNQKPKTDEEPSLDQKRVVSELIPKVKTEWKELMDSVKTRHISIHKLQKTFSTLKSDDEYMAELRILAMTGSGEPKKEKVDAWVAESATKLTDFSLLVRMQKWLPALLKIRQLFQTMFTSTKPRLSVCPSRC